MRTMYQTANWPAGYPIPHSPPPKTFTLSAPPGTDIWRKPHPHVDTFTAPIFYRPMPLSQFSHARVTFNARFQTLYDQAGLCFILPGAAGSGESKWIKTGVEFMDGKTNLSTVASDRWADWSLTPLPATYRSAGGPGAITIEMERYVIDGEPIDTLAIYVVHEPEDDSQPNERQLMREVTWVFEPGQLENQCWVGVMAAKPTKDDDDPERALEVTFSKFEISTIHDTRLPEEGRKGI